MPHRQSGRAVGEGFPLDNLTYDLVAIIHAKSEGLETYDQYLKDAQGDPEALHLLEDLRREEAGQIERVAHLLSQQMTTGAARALIGRPHQGWPSGGAGPDGRARAVARSMLGISR